MTYDVVKGTFPKMLIILHTEINSIKKLNPYIHIQETYDSFED